MIDETEPETADELEAIARKGTLSAAQQQALSKFRMAPKPRIVVEPPDEDEGGGEDIDLTPEETLTSAETDPDLTPPSLFDKETREEWTALAKTKPSYEAAKARGYKGYELSETGMAEYLFDYLVFTFQSIAVSYHHKSRTWFYFKRHWWSEDEGGKVRSLISEAYRYRCTQAIEKGDEAYARRLMLRYGSNRGAEGVLHRAEVLLGRKDADFNWGLHPELLGVSNGVVDLRTGLLGRGHPEQMINRHTPTRFEPGARAPRFRRFVSEIFGGDKDMVEFLQRAVGYSLTGETGAQKWFLCYGGGGNGKSTLLEDALLGAVGRSTWHVTKPETFLRQKYRSAISNDIRELKDTRAALVLREPAAWSELDESFLTGILTGTPEVARNLHERNVDFVPYFKLWMVANKKPRIRADTKGVWRRLLLLLFAEHFDPEDEPGLLATLRAEREGILAWAVEGAVKWYADGGQTVGLRIPAKVLADTEDYRRSQDELSDFWLTLQTEGAIRKGALYRHYKTWAQRARIDQPLGPSMFNERVETHFDAQTARGAKSGYELWRGLSVRPGWERQVEAP